MACFCVAGNAAPSEKLWNTTAPSPEDALYEEQELIVPRLPLEHFDDAEFEKLSPAEWIKVT